jgi:hypothetical protein
LTQPTPPGLNPRSDRWRRISEASADIQQLNVERGHRIRRIVRKGGK